MELRHLEYVIVLTEVRSMHAAADRLYVSQQNVSRVIKQLEDELQTKIFERSSQGVTLTSEGKDIYDQACIIVREAAKLKEKYTRSNFSSLKGNLTLYFSTSINRIAERYAAPFQTQYSNVSLTATELNSSEILRLLKTNPPLSAITFLQISADKLAKEQKELSHYYHCYLLAKEQLCVSMHKNNPFAQKPSISLKELAHKPFAVKSNSLNNLPNHIQVLIEKGVPLNLKYCSNSETFLIKYLKQNMAFTLSTQSNLFVSDSETVSIPIKEQLDIVLCLLIPQKDLSPSMQAFQNVFLKEAPGSCRQIF